MSRSYADRAPLHWAIMNNDRARFNTLLKDSTIDINQKDKFGDTPFHCAMKYTHRKFYIRALAREPNLRLDIKNNKKDTPFNAGLECFYCHALFGLRTIDIFIDIFPEHCRMAKAKYFSKLICHITDSDINANIIKDTLDHLIAVGITFDTLPEESKSFFKYLTSFYSSNKSNEFYLSHIASGDFSSDSNSKKAPEFSLLTKDKKEKRPIDYAWEGKNLPILVAMLDAGSPLPSKINIKDDLTFIKKHLEKVDLEKLSDTRNRLMITNTVHFVKNQQLGKRAISHDLRIPSSISVKTSNGQVVKATPDRQ
jgi:hypothetical protein